MKKTARHWIEYYTKRGFQAEHIARLLQKKRIKAPGGHQYTSGSVEKLLYKTSKPSLPIESSNVSVDLVFVKGVILNTEMKDDAKLRVLKAYFNL